MARPVPEWTLTIDIGAGMKIRKCMRGPATAAAAQAEYERQMRTVNRRTGRPFLQPGVVLAVEPRDPSLPRPPHVGAPLSLQLKEYIVGDDD